MYRGFAALSPRALRSALIVTVRLFSSTTVSGQRRSMSSVLVIPSWPCWTNSKRSSDAFGVRGTGALPFHKSLVRSSTRYGPKR